MNLSKAISTVRNFVDWRNGGDVPEPIASDVTEALEISLNLLTLPTNKFEEFLIQRHEPK